MCNEICLYNLFFCNFYISSTFSSFIFLKHGYVCELYLLKEWWVSDEYRDFVTAWLVKQDNNDCCVTHLPAQQRQHRLGDMWQLTVCWGDNNDCCVTHLPAQQRQHTLGDMWQLPVCWGDKEAVSVLYCKHCTVWIRWIQ